MFLRLLILSPLLIVLVVFALTNPQPVHFILWPTDIARDVPASLALLGALGVGMVLGALMLWFSTLQFRFRARRAERLHARLEGELKRMKSAPGTAVALPPPA
jgi:uncharacterized integral membrane protein